VFQRVSKDGLFPKVKPVEEMTAEDVPDLIKNGMSTVLRQLIELPNKDPKL